MTALLTADEAARLRPGEQLVIVRAGDDATEFCKADCPGQIPGYRRCGREAGHIGLHRSYWHDNPTCSLTWGTGFPVRDDDGGPDPIRSFVAPQDWVALTGPCLNPKCHEGAICVQIAVDEYETEQCDDCDERGRRIEPLYTECPGCNGHGFIGDISSVSGRVVPLTGCASQTCDGRVLAGRGSIEVVPVTTGDDSFPDATHITVDALGAVMLWVWNGSDFDPVLDLTLDPLPIPGHDFGIVIDCAEITEQ